MKDFRLKRLFNAKSGRCFDVAVDHGFFNQPPFLQGIEDMRTAIRTLVDAAPEVLFGSAPQLAEGRYELHWAAKSIPDGEVTEGAIGFTVRR